jgi:penicillin amidase
MQVGMPRISYDENGTPAVLAPNIAEAYAGLGWLHGRHRPLQALLLGAAGRGCLVGARCSARQLVDLDLLAHRLDTAERGRVEAQHLDQESAAWIDAYVIGFNHGLKEGGGPFELRLLMARLPGFDRASILSSVILASYLGTAQGQERMERALVDCLGAGGDSALLERMFAPHLAGWDPRRLAKIPPHVGLGMAAHRLVGGSNAWAVDGSRSAGGKPILCGDPHLQINQLPALFFEVRVRVGDDYWLGATFPGLPGVAVGRNRRIAWSSTFSVPDNVDFRIERLEAGRVVRTDGAHRLAERQVEVRRRFRAPLNVQFLSTEYGLLESFDDGDTLAVQWCGPHRAAEAIGAYLRIPTATSAEQAATILDGAHGFSLHWVVADSAGTVLYKQAGRIPRRSNGWSGLYPVPAEGSARWLGFYEGADLPRGRAVNGTIATANEARAGTDGATLSTLAQPPYRRERILELLAARERHDAASMQAIQLDLVSGQARRLAAILSGRLPDGPLRQALTDWDYRYDEQSRGAHAFDLAYRAALEAIAPDLGGDWMTAMLSGSELRVWWCNALDSLVADAETWTEARVERLERGLSRVARAMPRRWGDVQRFEMPHLAFGGLPKVLGFDRGPFPLVGSIGTVRQGYAVQIDGAPLVNGPAYRFVADLSEEGMWSTLPGGIDGSRWSETYVCWLEEWREGRYHRLEPPADVERG